MVLRWRSRALLWRDPVRGEAGGLALAEALFPGLLIALGVEYEGRVADCLHDQPVDLRPGRREWAQNVHEEHHACLLGVVPYLVVEGIVEHQALALLPVADVVAHPDAALLGVWRHDQAEVVAQDALVGAAVVEDVL